MLSIVVLSPLICKVFWSPCTSTFSLSTALQLKAFQQKKKKKKVRPKKSTDVVSEANTSVRSQPSSLTTGSEITGPLDSLGGKESPIPWDDFGQTSFEDDLNLPPDPLSRMSTSLPIVSAAWFGSVCVY